MSALSLVQAVVPSLWQRKGVVMSQKCTQIGDRPRGPMCYFDRSGMATKHLHRAMKGISARRAVAARTNHDGEKRDIDAD
jgi:hypothetical protein